MSGSLVSSFGVPERFPDAKQHEGGSRVPVVLSWSGGKDSSLALWALRSGSTFEVRTLLTTVTEGYERISMHGVRRELLKRQARAVGLSLVQMPIPPSCPNDIYEARMKETLSLAPLAGIEHVAFGDLFLEDIRSYREDRLARAGKKAVFPLWGRDTAELAHQFVDAGFDAVLVCVDPTFLDASFAGRPFDARLLEELPPGVDPCGENGEFHTFVSDGPLFSSPIPYRKGPSVARDGFVFCDLLPT